MSLELLENYFFQLWLSYDPLPHPLPISPKASSVLQVGRCQKCAVVFSNIVLTQDQKLFALQANDFISPVLFALINLSGCPFYCQVMPYNLFQLVLLCTEHCNFFLIVYCRILFIVEVQVPRIVKVGSTIGHQNYDSGWPSPSFVLPQSVRFVRYHYWVRGRCDMCAKRYFSDNGNDAVLSSPPHPMACCGCRTCG